MQHTKIQIQELDNLINTQNFLTKRLKEVNEDICNELILDEGTIASKLYFHLSDEVVNKLEKELLYKCLRKLTNSYTALVENINENIYCTEYNNLMLEEVYFDDSYEIFGVSWNWNKEILKNNSEKIKEKLK